jgi:molybdopterin-guanine dinucleotide biosynthesis protein A
MILEGEGMVGALSSLNLPRFHHFQLGLDDVQEMIVNSPSGFRPPHGLAALLLAGGASTRMGRPKALLEFAGQPFWKVQMDKLQALDPDELFVSIPRELSLPSGPWRVLYDEKVGLGPLSGLDAALQAMTGEWLVVLAVDLPEMTTAFLRNLHEAASETGCGLIPQLDGFYEGLAAIYPRSLADLCRTHLASDDRSLQRFARQAVADGQLAVYPVAEESRALFRNVNRPADL